VRSPLVDFKVSSPLNVVVGKTEKSYPDIASGSLQLFSFTGGLAPYQAKIELDSAASLQLPAFDTDFAEVTPNKDSQLEKVYDNVPPGRYIVQVQDSLGCSIEKIARVPLDTDILIPNIFTPNEDGQNDEFYIRNLPVDNAKLMVTSRWGKEVFSSVSYKNNWKADGIPDGVYFYTLQVGSGTAITGWVEVLRGPKP
jgi:gliding motility-associated-like protein